MKLTATLMTAAGGSAAIPPTALRWEVRDTSIAVIDSLGVLEARRIGRALVSASLTGRNPTATDSVVVDVVSPPRDTIAVVAHRGFALIAPENTLAAIDSAIDLGADAVEVDVVLTSDGVPVLMHDPTVDRTTDGSGAVSALTAAQVRALDACTWFGAGWAPCKVPTLDEALALAARRGGRLFLDLKGSYTTAQLGQLARQVRASGMHGRAMFISFDYRHLVALRAAEPSAPLGYLTHSLVTPEPLIALGATTALYSKVLLSAPSSSQHLDALRGAGVDAGVWTIVNAEEARALVARGVRRIITDVPLDRGALGEAR